MYIKWQALSKKTSLFLKTSHWCFMTSQGKSCECNLNASYLSEWSTLKRYKTMKVWTSLVNTMWVDKSRQLTSDMQDRPRQKSSSKWLRCNSPRTTNKNSTSWLVHTSAISKRIQSRNSTLLKTFLNSTSHKHNNNPFSSHTNNNHLKKMTKKLWSTSNSGTIDYSFYIIYHI